MPPAIASWRGSKPNPTALNPGRKSQNTCFSPEILTSLCPRRRRRFWWLIRGTITARQLPKLKEDQQLGKLEVVLCSHAHFDHYDGVYSILQRDQPQVWTLDHVAIPVSDPSLLRILFLDPRPVKFDRLAKDGETLNWREYRLRFRFLPGQTEFTMGVETEIDGKKCFFTADNFFHQDQFSGTGGWMGLNRSFPLPYAESAQKVLDAHPDWWRTRRRDGV